MAHRFGAGSLGLLIFALFLFSLVQIIKHQPSPFGLSLLLFFAVIFQAALGMWTVTLKLHPFVVMGHLLGGLTTLGLLGGGVLGNLNPVGASLGAPSTREPLGAPPTRAQQAAPLHRWALWALVILILQMALGGWTSANYAALACPDFPMCQASWWPGMDLKAAFTVWHEFGHNYEYGVLHNEGRVAIHMMHRIGAVITFIVVGGLGMQCVRVGVRLGGIGRTGRTQGSPVRNIRSVREMGFILLFILCAQIILGISNAVFLLPLPVAVAHSGMAALLLLNVLAVVKFSR